MSLPDFVVVVVMVGGDFDDTGAEVHIDIVVGDDFNGFFYSFNLNCFADILLIAFVFRIDGDGDVAEDGLGAGGGDNKGAVVEVVERGLLFLVFDLEVGEGGAAFGAVVDETKVAVDKSFVV